MKKTLLFSLILTSFVFAPPVLANDEVRAIDVDLKAKGFTQSQYQDNLEPSNIIFAPGDKFQVQLTITNYGNRNQTNVKVSESLPSDITTDTPAFILPQLAPQESYVKNIVVTVKGKNAVKKSLTANTIRFDINTDVGTKAGDFTTFYTSNGTLGSQTATVATPSASQLPATGADMILGTGIASLLSFAGLKLRKAIRGY